ncbi:MAG TPA: Ig-like domain-containing protein, partial [Sedimentisphaerales bacterium]|nr:Ig-like domain-containing protein [Sedimentisphaerales bacterium]
DSIGPLDFAGTEVYYEQPISGPPSVGSHVLVQIADTWLDPCPDCPTPPDLPPPVEPPQHAPIAADDDYVMGKGDTLLIIYADGVLGNDSDPDGDTIIIVELGGDTTELGTFVLQADGGFQYTPPAQKKFDTYDSDAEGDYALFIDSFEYHLQDEGGLNSNSATVTITAKNYIPVAKADSYDVGHNVSLDLTQPGSAAGVVEGVLPGNADYDPDPGDTLTAVLDGDGTTPLGGTVTLNLDGSFVYTPPENKVGIDSFEYYATDGYNNSGSVTVEIELTNTAPVAQADSYDVVHNVSLSPAVEQGVVEGALPEYADSDPDAGDTLTAVLVDGGSTLLGGTVTLNDDGSFTYTPPANQVGTDSFSYYVSDDYGATSEPVLVTINLTNTLPVAQPDSYSLGFDTSLSPAADQGIIVGVVPAVNGDYDLDPGDSLTPYLPGGLTTGTTAQGGTVTLNADGSFTYTPAEGWAGADSFTYYVTDGYGDSQPVLVTMLVGSAPAAPVAPFMSAAPGLERVEIVTSGCPALMAWTAAELGIDEGRIQVQIANALASGMGIQPCDACAGLKQAATILQDPEGTHIAALGQVINELASSTAPPSEEQMTSIANAIAQNVGAGNQYATAGEYIDALAKYVGILNGEMGFSADEAIQLVTDKYVGPLGEGQNAGLAAYVAARLAALGGS